MLTANELLKEKLQEISDTCMCRYYNHKECEGSYELIWGWYCDSKFDTLKDTIAYGEDIKDFLDEVNVYDFDLWLADCL